MDFDRGFSVLTTSSGLANSAMSLPAVAEHDYLSPVAFPLTLPTPIYGAMLVIWQLRPVLQRRFPLHEGKARDFLRFLAWCASEGRRQYAILRSIPDWDMALSRQVELPPVKGDRWAGGFSVAMFLFAVARHHYTIGPILRSASVRAKMARAYWRGERHKRFLPSPADWQRRFLATRFASASAFVNTIRLAGKDGESQPERLVEEFGLIDVVSVFAPLAEGGIQLGADSAFDAPACVVLPSGIRRSPIRLPLRAVRSISWMLDRLRGRPTEFNIAGITGRISVGRRPVPRSDHPFGVNLFGYARGEIGIGEDVRLVALALQAHGIPFCIVNVQPGSNVSQQDTSVEAWITDEPRYAINIFSVTGIELSRYACERGLDVFRGRYTIGFWPWELPYWPASCRHAYSVVDEIWGISRYTANAYRDAPRPVHAMTLPVVIDRIGDLRRVDFGLPEHDYLFVFSFDLNSTLTRKNPVAVIRAFERAFPLAKREKVGLVIKANHSNSAKGNDWLHVKAQINADPRIHLVDAILRKPDVLALYRSCDCYVSLHRAEGFGRGLAESLLLDLQVIATNFSGNLDFCSDKRVGLVRYKMRDLRPNDYFHGQGQTWADPDVRHAAELMRELVAAPRNVRHRDFDFSPTTVGARYARRLHEINQQLNPSGSFSC